MARDHLGDVLRDRGNQVGARHNRQQAHEMRDLDRDASAEAPLLQELLELVVTSFRPDHHVFGGEEFLHGESFARQCARLARDTYVAHPEQALLKKAGAPQIGKEAQRQIGLARFERGSCLVARHRT